MRPLLVATFALLCASAIALSAWQGALSRDSVGAHRSIELVGVVALGAMVVLGRRRQRQTSGAWAAAAVGATWRWRSRSKSEVISVLIWCALVAGVVGWDLFSFAASSHAYPTLSTLIGHITRHPIGRGLLFAAWLAVGAYVVAGWRTGRQR